MGVREILLQRALDLEIIPINQVHQPRVLNRPMQHIVTRVGTGSILLLLRFEIIDTVVRRDIHLGGHLRTHHLLRCLHSVYLEGGIEILLHRIGRWHKDITRSVRGLKLRCIQRGMITLRVIEHHIRHRRVTVSRHAGIVDRIEIRVVQLRLNHIAISFDISSQDPVLRVVDITRHTLTDLHIRTDVEGLSVQRLLRIPVYLHPSHIVLVVVRLRHFLHVVRVLLIVIRHHLALAVVDVRDLHDTSAAVGFHPRATVRFVVVRTWAVAGAFATIGENLVLRAVQLVVHIRLALVVGGYIVVVCTTRVNR